MQASVTSSGAHSTTMTILILDLKRHLQSTSISSVGRMSLGLCLKIEPGVSEFLV